MAKTDPRALFLYSVCIAFGAGVAFPFLFSVSTALSIVLLFCAVVALLVSAITKKKEVVAVAVVCTFIVLGILRSELFLHSIAQENLTQFTGSAEVFGVVANDPEVSGSYLHANIAVIKVNGVVANGKVLALLPAQTTLVYGQAVTLHGNLALPAPFMGDAGNVFDYPAYLRVQGVSMMLLQVQVYSVQAAKWSVQGALYNAKHLFDASLDRIVPEPDASLLKGILLGQRRGLSKEITEAFVVAGLIHIVILSGYSMSVVSEGVLRGLSWLPRKWQFAMGAALMVLFVIMTGAAATTVRACAMALVALVARYLHQQALALRSLAVVAATMVLWNPFILLHDVSFIVSVLATFGLIAFSPSIERNLPQFLQKHHELRSIVTSTVAVQIFALPMLLYFTGNLSLLSVPANLLVLPLLPFIMIAGLLTGLLAFVSGALAFVPAVVADLMLRWILLVVAVVERIPYSATTITAFPLWLALISYVPLTTLAIYVLRQNAALTQTS